MKPFQQQRAEYQKIKSKDEEEKVPCQSLPRFYLIKDQADA